ncbi:hypothetical protein ACFE04_029146 [Oxalis oulophora]
MKTTNSTIMNTHCMLFTSLLLLFSTFLLQLQPISATNSDENTEFIGTICNTTYTDVPEFSDFCFSAFSGYAKSVNKNPFKLTKLAISMSFSKAKNVTKLFFNQLSLSRQHDQDQRAITLLERCSDSFNKALHLIRDPLGEMSQIEKLATNNNETLTLEMQSAMLKLLTGAIEFEEKCMSSFNLDDDDDERIIRNIGAKQVDDVYGLTIIAHDFVHDINVKKE